LYPLRSKRWMSDGFIRFYQAEIQLSSRAFRSKSWFGAVFTSPGRK
jgi:hypothetical protein